MDELQVLLTNEIRVLNSFIEESDRCLALSPKGSLHISKNKNTTQFYHRIDPKDTHGIYIRKKDTRLITQLAQKEYAKKLGLYARKESENLKRCLQKYQPDEIDDIYLNMADSKRIYVKPYRLLNEEYIQAWMEEKRKLKKQHGKKDLLLLSEEDAILTELGERVRSKSEKILADKLYMLGIPYVYECPLYIMGYGYIYPDFMLLNCNKRKEYVYEHFGMMDHPEYCRKAIKKIESYQKNGIYPGKKLIIT